MQRRRLNSIQQNDNTQNDNSTLTRRRRIAKTKEKSSLNINSSSSEFYSRTSFLHSGVGRAEDEEDDEPHDESSEERHAENGVEYSESCERHSVWFEMSSARSVGWDVDVEREETCISRQYESLEVKERKIDR